MLDRLRRLDPVTVLAALVAGAVLYFVARRFNLGEQEKEILAGVYASVLLFIRPEKRNATSGDTSDAASLNRWGEAVRQENSTSANMLEVKRQILVAWVQKGHDIDDTLEAKAELQAMEILERTAKSLALPKDEPKP